MSIKRTFLIFASVFLSYWASGEAARSLGDISNPALSCFEILSKQRDESSSPSKSGYYWLYLGDQLTYSDEYYSGGLFQAYCDMTTEGGGWTLIAKITDDYSWICPDKMGQPCQGSRYPPSETNFWDDVHSRVFIKPEFVAVGTDSGVHLPRATVQKIFEHGLHSLRFSFYNTTNLLAPPADDAVASFYQPRELFHASAKVSYLKNQHYRFRVLRHSNSKTTTFQGSQICWLDSNVNSRRYEGGLFMGTNHQISNVVCHLDNNVAEVQLKSHYAYNGGTSYYSGKHGFLRKEALQVPHDAIMVWVR